jgi:hypothetical protein
MAASGENTSNDKRGTTNAAGAAMAAGDIIRRGGEEGASAEVDASSPTAREAIESCSIVALPVSFGTAARRTPIPRCCSRVKDRSSRALLNCGTKAEIPPIQSSAIQRGSVVFMALESVDTMTFVAIEIPSRTALKNTVP